MVRRMQVMVRKNQVEETVQYQDWRLKQARLSCFGGSHMSMNPLFCDKCPLDIECWRETLKLGGDEVLCSFFEKFPHVYQLHESILFAEKVRVRRGKAVPVDGLEQNNWRRRRLKR